VLAVVGCGGEGEEPIADATTGGADSAVAADARLGAPDGRPGDVDAAPGTPDAAPGTPDATSSAGRLFATEILTDTLVTIDLDGTITPVGSLGFDDVVEIAYAPGRDVFFGIDNESGTAGPARLIRIDPVTGAGSLVATLGTFTAISGMAYDPVDDILYAVRLSSDLLAIDPDTGEYTSVGDTDYISGLTFDPVTRKLYAADSEELRVIDPDDGAYTTVGPLSVWVRGLTLVDGTLYGVTDDDRLVTLNKLTAEMTDVLDLSGSIAMTRGLATR
jgi:hypothetical protein